MTPEWSTEELRVLREKAEAATPGPWHSSSGPSVWGPEGVLIGNLPSYFGPEQPRWRENHATAEFIAAADPSTVLALLDRIERLAGILGKVLVRQGGCDASEKANWCRAHSSQLPCFVACARAALEGP